MKWLGDIYIREESFRQIRVTYNHKRNECRRPGGLTDLASVGLKGCLELDHFQGSFIRELEVVWAQVSLLAG